MTEKHIADIDQVARDIYSYAAEQISAFLEQEYGDKDDSINEQMEDFHLIAERASVYIMGSMLALMEKDVQEESIAVHNKHLRSVISTISNMTFPWSDTDN